MLNNLKLASLSVIIKCVEGGNMAFDTFLIRPLSPLRSGVLKEYLGGGQRSTQHRNRTCSDSSVYDTERKIRKFCGSIVRFNPLHFFDSLLVLCVCVLLMLSKHFAVNTFDYENNVLTAGVFILHWKMPVTWSSSIHRHIPATSTFSVWRVLNGDNLPLKVVYILPACVCVCVYLFQVSCPVSTVTPPPFLKKEVAVWAQRPHPLTQTLTCPSEELAILLDWETNTSDRDCLQWRF